MPELLINMSPDVATELFNDQNISDKINLLSRIRKAK